MQKNADPELAAFVTDVPNHNALKMISCHRSIEWLAKPYNRDRISCYWATKCACTSSASKNWKTSFIHIQRSNCVQEIWLR